MPSHQERVREFAGIPETEQPSNISLAPINHFEDDIRQLLDHLECEYVGPDLAQCLRRLRKVVGYTS